MACHSYCVLLCRKLCSSYVNSHASFYLNKTVILLLFLLIKLELRPSCPQRHPWHYLHSEYLNGNYPTHLFMFPTCEAELLHTTTNLKASTSEGYDNISTKLLKQTVKEVATPLAHIVNLSLSQGILPNDMKLAKQIPIFKNGNKTIQ